MKRNRLNSPPSKSKTISSSTKKLNKKRHFLPLSLIGLTGVFITSIVLATSQPSITQKSSIIDLPNLPAKQQSASSTITKTPAPLAELKGISIPQDNKSVISIDDTSTTGAQAEQQSLALQTANITNSKTQTSSSEIEQNKTEHSELNWHDVKVKSGDNLSKIFPKLGLSAKDVYNVANLGKEIKPLLNLKPGQIIRFGLNSEGKLQTLSLAISQIKTLTVTAKDNGYQANTTTKDVDIKNIATAGTIKSSLFEAAMQAGLSDKITMELAQIFGWDIDFALDLRAGDSFKVVYQEKRLEGELIGTGAILAAEFINQGKKFQAIRYTDANNKSSYFSPSGDNMRKAFTRTPVHFSRISSKFSLSRKHPKLKGVTRPHRGVDYAAAIGTPILATGDGKVSFIGRKGGYGRTVILSHGGKYTTLYAHMSRYKKGLKAGKRVQQGDVIGYVGMSGTATGPHLHYEFRINGVHRNPLTVALPKAQPLNKKYLADFKKKASVLIAKLDTVSTTKLALKN